MNILKTSGKLCLRLLVFTIFVLATFQNCNEKESISCSSIQSIDNVTINVSGSRAVLSAKTWTEATDPDFGIMSTRLENESMISIKNALLNSTDAQSDFLEGIVLYLSNNTSNNFKNITLENITGFSLYESKSNMLFHRLFLNDNNGQFAVVNELSRSTSGFLFNDMNDIIESTIPKSKGFRAYILVANKDRNRKQKLRSVDELSRILNSYKRNTDIELRTGGTGDKRKCSKPCSGKYGSRCEGDPDVPECRGDCGDVIVHDYGNATEAMRGSNFSLHYKFRDEFLLNSTFGQSYLEYYDILSQDMAKNITPSLAFEILDFFTVFNPSLTEVLKPDASQSSYILITPIIHSKARSIINQYKTLTSDSALISILNNVEQDLDRYLNQPASFVLNNCCI